jgi:excisionase family DNA binding protein
MLTDREPDVLTVPQVAKRLGVSTAAIYDAIARGDIPVVPFSKRLKRIPARWLERHLSGDDANTL